MKSLMVVMACLAVAYGSGCDQFQREVVKEQWNEAYNSNREDFGTALWRHVFDEEPAAKEFFTNVGVEDDRSPKFLAHSDRVLGGLNTIISVLDDEATLNAELAHLRGQHDERGIPANEFALFRNALVHVVPALLYRCFDEAAWLDCYDGVIAPGITGQSF